MTQNTPRKTTAEELVKFYVPRNLKRQLQELAASRNIALSAMLRLVVSEYIKTRQ
ncbi:MAG: ribbon-helix-helix protein, CopG family [Anaerolineae bacterium]|nr:ribbon-helix-helix protein, CopG family [Anaerolineae bacterium]